MVTLLSCIKSCECNWSDVLQSLATCISALVASLSFVVTVLTVWYAQKEYKRMAKDKKNEVFMRYNQRYEENKYIRKIIRYCTIERSAAPTVHEKEMFLRFFEELERMIKSEYLSENDVCEYFSYYFLLLWNDDKNFFWDEEMLKPYESLQAAQDSIEWSNLTVFYNRIIRNQNHPSTENHIFPNKSIQQ